ncbi:MAG: hypothetical protein V3S79_06600 [Candidatus Thermoplasmatota archaeon]
MSSKSNLKIKIKKIDALIVVILIIIAGLVLVKAGYIYPLQEDIFDPDEEEEEIKPIPPPPPTPPESITMGFMRAVSPEDEGVHFDKIQVSREWWYFSAVFNENSDLNGWVVSISFNHMTRGDLIGTSKPDLLVITLHGPNGEEYGGMINKERGLGIIKQPTLKANSPGVNVRFEDSWAEGESPEWHVHAEDNEIDNNHDIIIDLNYFAPFEPIWTIGDKAFENINSNLASYIFTGCNVNGKIIIDGKEYFVNGTGHHEHSWSPNIVTRGLINGWDWFHITLENGWNIYYVNYYSTPQFVSSLTSKINPYGSLIITTDKGNTITILDNINPEITKSNDEIFPFVRIPLEINLNAKAGLVQPLLSTYNIQFDIDIKSENTYDKIWKFPTYVGMSIGRSSVIGTIQWTDNEGNHEVELAGIGTQWSMRALL